MEVGRIGLSAASMEEVVLGHKLLELVLDVRELLSGELVLIQLNLGFSEVSEVVDLGWQQEKQSSACGTSSSTGSTNSMDVLLDI